MTDDLTNDERSAAEVAAFIAEVPERYFAYAPKVERGTTITTWTGAELGLILSVRPVYVSNMEDKRQNFRARAINGAEYSGTAYLSAGDYVRMRKVQS
jgi:hypothetical protein